jgi:hypothetical protein
MTTLRCPTLWLGSLPYSETLGNMKNLVGANTLAYFAAASVTTKKFFFASIPFRG